MLSAIRRRTPEARGREERHAARAGVAPGNDDTEIGCYFGPGGPYLSNQHRKIRRIRFVTPTKLPYPWNLMS